MAAFLARVALFADLPLLYLRRIAAPARRRVTPRQPDFQGRIGGDSCTSSLSGSVRIKPQVPGMGEKALAHSQDRRLLRRDGAHR